MRVCQNDMFVPLAFIWLSGLGVWFSLWVREVPGSNPGWALIFCSPGKNTAFRGHTDLNHGPIGLQPIALPLSYIPYMWLCGMSLPVLEPRLPKKCTVSDNQSESQVFSDSDAPSVHTNLHLLAASTVKLGDCRSKYVSSQLRGQLMSVCEWTWKSLSHLRSCLHR